MLPLLVTKRLYILILLPLAISFAAAGYITSISDHDTPSPLNRDGSDFPCKGSHFLGPLQLSQMHIGSANNSFTSFSLHQLQEAEATSGSCQISISLDPIPNRNSIFKVLKSIGTGCPVKDPEVPIPGQFPFSIPANFPNSDIVTIAMTWFPTGPDGHPNMHMECIRIQLVGGSTPASDMTAFDALPDMFTANIGNDCATSVTTNNINFPNPGQDYDAGPIASAVFADPIGDGCQAPILDPNNIFFHADNFIHRDNFIHTRNFLNPNDIITDNIFKRTFPEFYNNNIDTENLI
ncbi:hypothetical protein QBC43DRAFT_330964 [Cladorrhinum sp. PSN259]|nr:hypothetical protein QBC43DRAFT_330964 [Cladorrhinum sp. PSN259]